MSKSENDPEFIIGPFTKQSFNLRRWRDIKEKIYHLNTSNEEETIPYCKDLLQFLVELNSCDNYDEYFGDPGIKKFFFQEFFGINAKNLIATRTFNDPELLEISNSCLNYMVTFWIKAMDDDDVHLVEMAKVILDPQKSYFKFNNQESFSHSAIVSFKISNISLSYY